MTAPIPRPYPAVDTARLSSIHFALRCARNVHAAIDRRMPEAQALVAWLAQHSSALNLPESAVPEDESYSSRQRPVTPANWRKMAAALQVAQQHMPAEAEGPAEQWVKAVGAAMRLDVQEAGILGLALHYKVNSCVERLFDLLSECRGGASRLHRNGGLIGLLLQVPPAEVAARLTPDSRLQSGGLLHVDRWGDLFVLKRLHALLRREVCPAADIHDQLLGVCSTAPLPWEAFAHLGQEADIASAVLQAALAQRERGVNILLYGPPGTGKTSFAATLAARIGVRLRPVAETDDDGDEPERDQRLAGLRLAQRLAAPGSTLLLFDEAEDLFAGSRTTEMGGQAAASRVFIHRLMEGMSSPVIWTANNIQALGPAVLRRMTLCLELKVPNLSTRTRLWQGLGDSEGVPLQEADAARLARLVPAAPAVAATALRATRLAGGDADTVRLIVEGMARAVHGGDLPPAEPVHEAAYDPALVNADEDLLTLAEDLLQPDAPRAVSFLLSGPPGAGKSAWVRYLAGRMGLPVLQKRGSDLFDPYVGGTEQAIARAFAEAREAQAFLVFDEADGLLLNRAEAARGWEISQVNEMLTWMESHPLPFACTTNLPERLDPASLRRFLVKLRFGWLTPVQAGLAFRQFFGMTPPAGLAALPMLTPADFALVRRRAAVRGRGADAAVLLRLLAAECEARVGGRAPLGFAGGSRAA